MIDSTAKCMSALWISKDTKPLVSILCKHLKSNIVQTVIGDILSDKNPEILGIKVLMIKAISQKIVKKAEKTLP
jgi:hypothetical protein